MNDPIHSFRIGFLIFLAGTFGVTGQVATNSTTAQQVSTVPTTQQAASYQAMVQAFREEQIELAQEEYLQAQGATPAQLAAWRAENASSFALQNQRAEALAIASALRLRSETFQARVPANASPALKALLATQASLTRAEAHIHNQLVQQAIASGQTITFAQISSLRRQEDELFRQQNATLLTLEGQQSQVVTVAQARKIRPIPASDVIPANATPQMAAYLTTRSQMARSLIEVENQYATATLQAREAAMRNWSQQNAAGLAQLQQQAQTLTPARTTIDN